MILKPHSSEIDSAIYLVKNEINSGDPEGGEFKPVDDEYAAQVVMNVIKSLGLSIEVTNSKLAAHL